MAQFNNSHPTPESLTTPSDVISDVMPGWNGRESIVAYIIRQKCEERIRVAQERKARIILCNVVLWPLAALATVVLVSYAMGI